MRTGTRILSIPDAQKDRSTHVVEPGAQSTHMPPFGPHDLNPHFTSVLIGSYLRQKTSSPWPGPSPTLATGSSSIMVSSIFGDFHNVDIYFTYCQPVDVEPLQPQPAPQVDFVRWKAQSTEQLAQYLFKTYSIELAGQYGTCRFTRLSARRA